VSDHLDAPGLKSPNMEVRVDITDIFAFQNPADPTRFVLAMNVNPVAPTLADSFAPEAVYELIPLSGRTNESEETGHGER
jgi:hypothetical protein